MDKPRKVLIAQYTGLNLLPMPSPSKDFLRAAIDRLQLESLQSQALEIVARDAIGMIQSAASSQISSQTNRGRTECDQVLLDLVGRGLLTSVDLDPPRLFADYSRLGISEHERRLLVQAQSFQTLGQPHSPEAMATLLKLFEQSVDAIYLGLEVTSHEVFSALDVRAASGRLTVFLMPPKTKIVSQRREHYDEVLRDWVKFLKAGPAHRRAYVRLYISPQVTPDMYTSALAKEVARFDAYWFASASTRTGQILQSQAGTSLYTMIEGKYRRALAQATPLFGVWPKDYCLALLSRFGPFTLSVALIGVGMLLSRTKVVEAASAFFIGLAANIFTGLGRNPKEPERIYK